MSERSEEATVEGLERGKERRAKYMKMRDEKERREKNVQTRVESEKERSRETAEEAGKEESGEARAPRLSASVASAPQLRVGVAEERGHRERWTEREEVVEKDGGGTGGPTRKEVSDESGGEIGEEHDAMFTKPPRKPRMTADREVASATSLLLARVRTGERTSRTSQAAAARTVVTRSKQVVDVDPLPRVRPTVLVPPVLSERVEKAQSGEMSDLSLNEGVKDSPQEEEGKSQEGAVAAVESSAVDEGGQGGDGGEEENQKSPAAPVPSTDQVILMLQNVLKGMTHAEKMKLLGEDVQKKGPLGVDQSPTALGVDQSPTVLDVDHSPTVLGVDQGAEVLGVDPGLGEKNVRGDVVADFELASRLHAEELRRKRAKEALEYADAQFARSLASDDGEGESEVSPSAVKGVGSRFDALMDEPDREVVEQQPWQMVTRHKKHVNVAGGPVLPAPCLSVPPQDVAAVAAKEVVKPPHVQTFSEAERATHVAKWEKELQVVLGEVAGESARVTEAVSHAKVARGERQLTEAVFVKARPAAQEAEAKFKTAKRTAEELNAAALKCRAAHTQLIKRKRAIEAKLETVGRVPETVVVSREKVAEKQSEPTVGEMSTGDSSGRADAPKPHTRAPSTGPNVSSA